MIGVLGIDRIVLDWFVAHREPCSARSWRSSPSSAVPVWVPAASTVVVVGITRLYLAAHWLTDVLGGWAFGTLWFLSVLAAARIGACAPSPSTPTGSPN